LIACLLEWPLKTGIRVNSYTVATLFSIEYAAVMSWKK
jgi:hypothetical protein